MKASLLFLPVVFHRVYGSSTPTLQWDPDTAADCVEWYNNGFGETCEHILNLFGISREEFHEWNPSVGLDCQPWQRQSYCILTMGKYNETHTTTSSSSTTTVSTSTSVTPGPSPTAWTEMGCYIKHPTLPSLEVDVSPEGGDPELTIPKCEDTCYLKLYNFAGVLEGNQCWCSSYVAGGWASNQTDCNIPCTGDSNTFCGGKGLFNVFRAEQNEESTTITTTTATTTGNSTTSSLTGSTTSKTQSSGVMTNLAMF